MEMNGQRNSPAALTLARNQRTYFIGGWVRFRDAADVSEKKYFFVGIITPNCPVQSIYGLSYTGF
jgi:hypothetical protein